MSKCYECGEAAPLVHKSRCVTCVIRRLKFNEQENDTLHDEIARLEAALVNADLRLERYLGR